MCFWLAGEEMWPSRHDIDKLPCFYLNNVTLSASSSVMIHLKQLTPVTNQNKLAPQATQILTW